MLCHINYIWQYKLSFLAWDWSYSVHAHTPLWLEDHQTSDCCVNKPKDQVLTSRHPHQEHAWSLWLVSHLCVDPGRWAESIWAGKHRLHKVVLQPCLIKCPFSMCTYAWKEPRVWLLLRSFVLTETGSMLPPPPLIRAINIWAAAVPCPTPVLLNIPVSVQTSGWVCHNAPCCWYSNWPSPQSQFS